jgi:putative transposase
MRSNQLKSALGKKQALAAILLAFSSKKEREQHDQQAEIDELYHQLGQVVAERDWLKKVNGYPLALRKALLEPANATFSLRQQCGLLGTNRSSLYYQPQGESDENLLLMRLLDEQYTQTPYYGVFKMTAYLRTLGHVVNEKRVRRLLRMMG